MKKSIAIIVLLAWPLYLNDLYLIALGGDRLDILWTLDVIFFLLIPVTTLIWLLRSKRITLAEIGLGASPRPVSIFAGLALCGILIVLIEKGLRPWIEGLLPWELFAGYDFPARQPLRGCLIVYASLSAGALEEIVYRGVVISQMRKHGKSAAFAVAASCLVFAGIHWGEGLGKLIWTATWALVPAIWFVKTRTLWGQMTCHATYLLLIYTALV